mmetsp:Transcript_92079/g.263193  ORF Transcript_92079/g.263193 Transcript_92079/m.263193 type:complete len:93 (+) Transcript_92079:187-465(+)
MASFGWIRPVWTTVPIAPMQAPVNAPVAKTVGVFERGIKAEATMETTEGGTRELFTMAFDPHGSYLRLFETRGGGGMVQQPAGKGVKGTQIR